MAVAPEVTRSLKTFPRKRFTRREPSGPPPEPRRSLLARSHPGRECRRGGTSLGRLRPFGVCYGLGPDPRPLLQGLTPGEGCGEQVDDVNQSLPRCVLTDERLRGAMKRDFMGGEGEQALRAVPLGGTGACGYTEGSFRAPGPLWPGSPRDAPSAVTRATGPAPPLPSFHSTEIP